MFTFLKCAVPLEQSYIKICLVNVVHDIEQENGQHDDRHTELNCDIQQTFVILNVVLLNVMEPRKRRSCFIRRMDIKLYRTHFLSKQRNKKY